MQRKYCWWCCSFLDSENVFGKNKKLDRLTVMDDVSGLADKYNDFASSLTVSQKLKCSFVCILKIIYPEKPIRKLIL